MSQQMVIIGAGLAGLSAAYTAARQGWQVWLCSSLPSERAQSVMAEGGINAALDTQGQEIVPTSTKPIRSGLPAAWPIPMLSRL
ncbi:FAD-dependent oxidoreductase [uncultured Megasphaera sp.]|uniref:FAD-dependent oxidoreductase n=1 Tax=uncultured Megasphaera sp. TaxID=165188 RepID=UPI00266BF275|nr:FAD-dependent oxidoreductase [uncultured Megasphaera sp.]